MIYHFEPDDINLSEFVQLLSDRSLDHEIIKRDKVVVRIFGRVDEDLRQRLDRIAGRFGPLTLKRLREKAIAFPPLPVLLL